MSWLLFVYLHGGARVISIAINREEAKGYERRRLATAMALLSGWISVPRELSLARATFGANFIGRYVK